MHEVTICIVDDEESIVDSLTAFFEGKYNILHARNVERAIAVLTEHADAIDVVVLDLTMPLTGSKRSLTMNAGLQVVREARGDGSKRGLAPSAEFVALTANRDVNIMELTLMGIGTVMKAAPQYLQRLDDWIKQACLHRKTLGFPSRTTALTFPNETEDIARLRKAVDDIKAIVEGL